MNIRKSARSKRSPNRSAMKKRSPKRSSMKKRSPKRSSMKKRSPKRSSMKKRSSKRSPATKRSSKRSPATKRRVSRLTYHARPAKKRPVEDEEDEEDSDNEELQHFRNRMVSPAERHQREQDAAEQFFASLALKRSKSAGPDSSNLPAQSQPYQPSRPASAPPSSSEVKVAGFVRRQRLPVSTQRRLDERRIENTMGQLENLQVSTPTSQSLGVEQSFAAFSINKK